MTHDACGFSATATLCLDCAFWRETVALSRVAVYRSLKGSIRLFVLVVCFLFFLFLFSSFFFVFFGNFIYLYFPLFPFLLGLRGGIGCSAAKHTSHRPRA